MVRELRSGTRRDYKRIQSGTNDADEKLTQTETESEWEDHAVCSNNNKVSDKNESTSQGEDDDAVLEDEPSCSGKGKER